MIQGSKRDRKKGKKADDRNGSFQQQYILLIYINRIEP